MNIRNFAYSLAIVMLSYDVLSTLIASKLYKICRFKPSYNFLGQNNPAYFCILMAIVITGLIFVFWVALLSIEGERLSEKMCIIQEIASALIAGVIVDWKLVKFTARVMIGMTKSQSSELYEK